MQGCNGCHGVGVGADPWGAVLPGRALGLSGGVRARPCKQLSGHCRGGWPGEGIIDRSCQPGTNCVQEWLP